MPTQGSRARLEGRAATASARVAPQTHSAQTVAVLRAVAAREEAGPDGMKEAQAAVRQVVGGQGAAVTAAVLREVAWRAGVQRAAAVGRTAG